MSDKYDSVEEGIRFW